MTALQLPIDLAQLVPLVAQLDNFAGLGNHLCLQIHQLILTGLPSLRSIRTQVDRRRRGTMGTTTAKILELPLVLLALLQDSIFQFDAICLPARPL